MDAILARLLGVGSSAFHGVCLDANAPGTKKQYAKALLEWEGWRQGKNLVIRNVQRQRHEKRRWLASLRERGLGEQAIGLRLAALRQLHLFRGAPWDVDPLYGMYRKSLRNERGREGRGTKKARALGVEELAKAGPVLGRSSVVFAALVVAFDGMLRKGELAAESRRDEAPLRMQDLKRNADGSLTLLIRRSKTDQAAAGAKVKLWRHDPASPICPVRAIERMLAARTARRGPEDPLFAEDAEGTPLRKYTLELALRRCAGSLRWKGPITSHSLRRGGTSAHIAAGFPTEYVRERGRWAPGSRMVYHYNDARWGEAARSRAPGPLPYEEVREAQVRGSILDVDVVGPTLRSTH